MLQTLITALIVAGCAAYAGWALMPAAWQRGLARALGRRPLAPSGCGACGACGVGQSPPRSAKPASPAQMAGTSVVSFQRHPDPSRRSRPTALR